MYNEHRIGMIIQCALRILQYTFICVIQVHNLLIFLRQLCTPQMLSESLVYNFHHKTAIDKYCICIFDSQCFKTCPLSEFGWVTSQSGSIFFHSFSKPVFVFRLMLLFCVVCLTCLLPSQIQMSLWSITKACDWVNNHLSH